MLFSTIEYARSLKHIGNAVFLESLNTPLLVRSIPATTRCDVTGSWPYADLPSSAQLRSGIDELRAAGFVSLTMFIRPDAATTPIPNGLAEMVTLKQHYVLDPGLPAPILRAKTRRNLVRGAKFWEIVSLSPSQIARFCPRLQALLATRSKLSAFAAVTSEHFHSIARIAGIEALAAVDREGPGAILVSARNRGETHLLHLLVAPRVIRTCGTYLLLAEALSKWSGDGCVYLGGVPGSRAARGIAQFKARWANRLASTHLLKVVLDRKTYAKLAAGHPCPSYFPAYRKSRQP